MRAVAALLCVICASAEAALPGGVARAFGDAGIPLSGVSVVVRESGQPQPLFSHDPDRPMNPASVMKVVTTYAALDLLGPEYRWKTEAYLGGKLDRKGTLAGNLVIKGYGDPKITIEQWQAFMAALAHAGPCSGHRRPAGRPLVLQAAPTTMPPRST
jgi:D-alanyl-D-alanine carboxypeptidase/D-alanyl-D-alanine-endopeptidase (penicillin-binding protein 4)